MTDPKQDIYIGTDSGATTSKVGGVRGDGSIVSTKLTQKPTNALEGPQAVVNGWVAAASDYLEQNGLQWSQVRGVGLAIPGPFQRRGVLDRSANLPASFAGWNVQDDYSKGLSARAGRTIDVIVGNDGNYGGVAEAQQACKNGPGSVLMLMPGSGLGCAFVDHNGIALDGDHLAGMEAAHMPAPLHLLGNIKPFPCGCGRNWGCVETYTTISGLPHLLAEKLLKYPDHELAKAPGTPKEKALSLRGRAQKGDALAIEIFDFQARVLGLHVASLTMALDPKYVVISGGLMDPEATTEEFRKRYLRLAREAAEPYLFPAQRASMQITPAVLGDLSPAIGAALSAMYQHQAKP